MKFRNISQTYMHDVYGYDFAPGDVVEITEPNLCAKFVNYGWTEEVTDGLQEQGQEIPGEGTDAAAEAGPVDRDALKAQADALGIKYHAKIKTDQLIARIEAHGGN